MLREMRARGQKLLELLQGNTDLSLSLSSPFFLLLSQHTVVPWLSLPCSIILSVPLALP